MKNQRTLVIGVGLAIASGWAHAQSTATQAVTIYGLVDLAVEHVGNVGPHGDGLIRMPGLSGSLPSRLGFRGDEDLGDGLRAVYTLEAGFGADTGTQNQGGRFLGRQAFVGLSGSWGTLSLGRQYTMLFWSLLDADILGPNLYGSGSLDSYIPNARVDNSIAYRGAFNGFTVGATYSLGRDAVNAGPSPGGTNCPGESGSDPKACREWSALVKYDASTWGVALATDQFRGGSGAFAGLTNSALQDKRVSANGYLKLGTLKLAGGLIRRDNDGNPAARRSDLWYVGAAYPVTSQLAIDGQLFRLDFKGSANEATLAAIRATYSLSKRTALYVTAAHIDNDGKLALSASSGQPGSNPSAGESQTAFATGIRHSF